MKDFLKNLSKRNKILLVVVFLLVSGLVINFYVYGKKRIEIQTAKVKRGEIIVTQTETGDVRASRNVTITAPQRAISSLVIVDMIPEGTTVEQGDTLIKFDTKAVEEMIDTREDLVIASQQRLEKLEAQQLSIMQGLNADLSTIKNNYELAKLTLESMQYESESKKQETQLQYDNAKLNYEAQLTELKNQNIINKVNKGYALRDLQDTKKELGWIKELLKGLTILSPGHGLVVYKENFVSGTLVKVAIGDNVYTSQPLIELPDLNEIQVKLRVNEIDVGKYDVGQEVIVTLDAYSEKSFKGTVTEISPLVEGFNQNLRLFSVIITLEEKNNPIIRPGMTARTEIVLKKVPDALFVPVEAVFEKNGKPIIFSKSSGFKQKEVTIGDRNSNYIIVNDLKEDEEVALIDPTKSTVRLGTAQELALRMERRREIIEKYLSSSNLSSGNEEQKRITNPNQLSPELIGEYLKELLKNPEIKKEYDKRSKEDPNFIKDPQKGTQFYMDMIQKIREQSKEEK